MPVPGDMLITKHSPHLYNTILEEATLLRSSKNKTEADVDIMHVGEGGDVACL